MIKTQNTRLAPNPAVQLIRSTNDEIIVRFGSRGRATQRIADSQRRGILADLVSVFDGGAYSDEVCEQFGNDAEIIISGLVESGVLVPESELEFGFLTVGFGSATPEISSLNVIGEGSFAKECVRLLNDVLKEKVAIRSLSAVEVYSEPADFTVCVADSPNTGLFYDMNEYALSYNAVWHGGYLDGPEIIVGPLFVPGETGCYHDFDVMEEAGRSMKLDHLFMKMNGASTAITQVPEFVASLAASYLTTSVLQHILGIGSHLESHLLRIDLDRLEIIRQRATRLARCPACVENRPDIRSPFL